MNRTRAFALIAGLSVIVATPAQAQFESVGSIDFPTSATGEAQQHFLRGVAIPKFLPASGSLEKVREGQLGTASAIR